MSLVPAPKLLITLAVLKFLFNMMDDMLESMTKMVAFKNDSVRIVGMLIALGAAMILMATAVRILAGMDLKGAVVGMVAMKVLMETLQTFMTKMATTKGVERGAGILLALAAACVILSLAVYTLGSMDTGKAIQGVVTLAAVVAVSYTHLTLPTTR